VASWNDLVRYVRKNYRIQDQDEYSIKLGFDVGDDRSQIVVVSLVKLTDDEEEWMVLESAIGELDEIDLGAALREVGEMVCGGLALVTDTLVGIRHAVPLANLDVNEFESPLTLVTLGADHLEKLLVGGDDY